jgi:hypothetical protein
MLANISPVLSEAPDQNAPPILAHRIPTVKNGAPVLFSLQRSAAEPTLAASGIARSSGRR